MTPWFQRKFVPAPKGTMPAVLMYGAMLDDDDNRPYLTVLGAADNKFIVAKMEWDKRQDDYTVTDTSVKFTSRVDALTKAVDWADADKLEIR